jgi:hypothetical protein
MRVSQKKQVSNTKRGRSQPVIYTQRVWPYKQKQTDKQNKSTEKGIRVKSYRKEAYRITYDKMVQPSI